MAQLDRASIVASIVNLDRPITAVQFITPNFQLCRTELTTRRDDVVTFFQKFAKSRVCEKISERTAVIFRESRISV